MSKNQEEILQKLIENAFDFLETAIDQIDKFPKYSVINFCAAVELLLKARLMKEHWSLIVAPHSDPNQGPNLNRFKVGDFRSINFSDLIPKIMAITGEKIPDDVSKTFNNLAKHRNKMIHFYHEAHTGNNAESEELLRTIALEQYTSWYYLLQLFKQWNKIFQNYEEKINKINSRIKRYDEYLNIVFEKVKPEIEELKNRGSRFISCRRCKKIASEEILLTDNLFAYECKVCHLEEHKIKILCPACDEIIIIDAENILDIICENCNSPIDEDFLKNNLDTSNVKPEDYYDSRNINCAECDGYGTVIQHYNYYICLNCLSVTDHAETCDWCNEMQINGADLEYSYLNGCNFCDGKGTWERD